MKDKKICFVSPNIYPVLTGDSGDFMGGAEFQQAIIGRHIHGSGYEVAFATKAFDGRRRDESIDGMRVYKTFSDNEGFPLLRFLLSKVPRTWRAMKVADADIYYQRGASALTGIVALFCRLHGKKFVFSAAHDTNFLPKAINIPFLGNKILYLWGLKNAAHILVQSHHQKRLLRENFGLDAHVLYNVYPARDMVTSGEFVLWVANIKPMKRPWLFLEIAKACPKIPFKMVGGRVKGHERLYETIKAEAARINNLEFLGFQPLAATENLFDQASLFINTSEMEGFPNTFLQAWSRGIPTASFFDADDIIQKNDLGMVVTDIKELAAGNLEKLLNSSYSYRQHIQSYFNAVHLPERYLESLNSLLC